MQHNGYMPQTDFEFELYTVVNMQITQTNVSSYHFKRLGQNPAVLNVIHIALAYHIGLHDTYVYLLRQSPFQCDY